MGERETKKAYKNEKGNQNVFPVQICKDAHGTEKRKLVEKSWQHGNTHQWTTV